MFLRLVKPRPEGAKRYDDDSCGHCRMFDETGIESAKACKRISPVRMQMTARGRVRTYWRVTNRVGLEITSGSSGVHRSSRLPRSPSRTRGQL